MGRTGSASCSPSIWTSFSNLQTINQQMLAALKSSNMCGIAGVIYQAPVGKLRSFLEPMQRALRHRGPDDEGTYLSNDGCCGLAHTRLSILDLTPAGHQPMGSGGQRAESGEQRAGSQE